jgi:dTDP-4-amino-4,6-dideoxygalactose transaminase
MKKESNNRKVGLMRPLMPDRDHFMPYMEQIWDSRILTNDGPVLKELTRALETYLDVGYISLCSSGTLALALALKSLDLEGEVITTPFTSIATAQAIHWSGLKPVFADIDETDLNIDPERIEAAITSRTCAILPVHLFGNPCNVGQIRFLAEKYNLRVIYDAAHCFGVKLHGSSVCNYGDLSVLSFHATKVYNTIEGGAVVCHDEATRDRLDALRNVGIVSKDKLAGYGLNAKMNEFQAAFGLANLRQVDEAIRKRKAATQTYRGLISKIKGIRTFSEKEGVVSNYTYFPIIIDPEEFGASRDAVAEYLEQNNIFTKKYFFPLVTDFPEFKKFRKQELPTARRIADNVLCLPLFPEISYEEIVFITEVLAKAKNH